MSRVRTTIQAGVCGFTTEITAGADDEQQVQFTIASPCANIQGLATALPVEIDAYAELGMRFDGEIGGAARSSRLCSGCIVPAAMLKAMQVACGLALPVHASIAFARLEE